MALSADIMRGENVTRMAEGVMQVVLRFAADIEEYIAIVSSFLYDGLECTPSTRVWLERVYTAALILADGWYPDPMVYDEQLDILHGIARDCNDDVVRILACCTAVVFVGDPQNRFLRSPCKISTVWAGRAILAWCRLSDLPIDMLDWLQYVEWDDATTGGLIQRHMLRCRYSLCTYSQLWDRQAHMLRVDERRNGYARAAAKHDALFGTLLLAFGRFEADKTIAVAHSAMLEDMFELVPFLQEE